MQMRRVITIIVFALSAAGCAHCDRDLASLATDAALDDPAAQYDLGVWFFKGQCVPQDMSKAAALWEKALASSNLDAYNNLGWLEFNGQGVPKDEGRAAELWRFAAERGQPESQTHLAYAYLTGRGAQRDPIIAYAWATVSLHSIAAGAGGSVAPDIERDARRTAQSAEQDLDPAQKPEAERLATSLCEKFCFKPHALAPSAAPAAHAVDTM
jgi:TPR repeat protein